MTYRQAVLAAGACVSIVWGAFASEASAAVPVEIANQAGPHGTAPREWLQRLAEAGAGPTRLVTPRGPVQPRLDDLGASPAGKPMVRVYAVLTRSNELLLPVATGFKRFRPSDRTKLADYFKRLESEGAASTTAVRGKFGLTEVEFTDLFTRMQRPAPSLAEGATLRDALDAAARTTRLSIDPDPKIARALMAEAEDAAAVGSLTTGTALALLLRQEGLALAPEKPIGKPTRLRVVAARKSTEAWPLGYKPEGSPSQTAPGLMDFLTVEIEGYTLAEALDAIGPRITWKERALPIVYDRFAMRAASIDPAAIEVTFPRKRTFFLKLLDRLAAQARLRVDLRTDEAGTPYVWLTR